MSDTTTWPTDEERRAGLAEAREGKAAEYAKLSNAALRKKINHLRRAVGRCSLAVNAEHIVALLAIACDEARRRETI